MTQFSAETEASRVLTIEEITNLTHEGGKPADTLMNVVALIAARFRTEVCSAYLLEPDRSNLVLAATLGLHPRAIGTLRMPLSEGLSGLVAEKVVPVAVSDVRNHPRFKYFTESGEEEYHSFLGVPLIDRGVLQGVLVVQTKEPRVFRDDEIRLLCEAASEVAPVVSEARTLDRFIAPAQERLWALARNLWWSWDDECVDLFRDLNPTRWRQLNQNPIALLSEIPLGEIERRATELSLHSRINYAYRRQQEYLSADQTWGANTPACCGRGPWPISPPSSVCTSRCRSTPAAWACWLATTSRARPTWTFRWSGSAFSTGRATFCSGWTKRLAARGVSSDRCQSTADAAGHRRERRAGGGGDCHARRLDPRQGVARARWAAAICCCSTRMWPAMRPRICEPPRASMAATRARASGRSCCWAWAAIARSRPWASRPAFCI